MSNATLEAVARESPGYDRATEFETGLQLILAGLRYKDLATER